MIRVANYKCGISDKKKFSSEEISIEDVEEFDKKHDHEILVWNNNFEFKTEHLESFPNLKYFINWGVNDRNITVEEQLIKRKVVIKKVDYYSTETLSEYVLALMLNFERKLHLLISDNKVVGSELYGKRIGIIGLGKIGMRLAQILKNSFNCEIFYLATKDKKLKEYKFSNLKEIFKVCDYAIITIKSKGVSIDNKLLSQANKDLVIVNISDDEVLPFKYILPLIKEGKLGGYISDLIGLNTGENNDKVVLVNKYGYLTEDAKVIKDNILLAFFKKYVNIDRENSVYLVRHGQTEWNKKGVFQGRLNSPLTIKGRNAAEEIGKRLAHKNIKIIFTSPLGRAKDTALIIAEQIKAEVVEVPNFREMNFGIFEGKSREGIKLLFPEFFADREENKYMKLYESYPQGESYFDVFLRILKPLMEILSQHKSFVIVGHESVNRIIRGIIRELPLEEMVSLRQKNEEVIEIKYPSLSEVVHTT